MRRYVSKENNEALRLNITSVSGGYSLFYQFNIPEEDRKREAVSVFSILLANALRINYCNEGLKKYGDAEFYKLHLTNNTAGFCISIMMAYASDQEEALMILEPAFRFVSEFDPDSREYVSDSVESMIRNNLESVKEYARKLHSEIFDEGSICFYKEHIDPFD